MMRAFLPPMLEMNHGSIVAISAVCGHIGMPNMIPYAASKFGIRDRIYNALFLVIY